MKVITYKNENGGLSIVHPAQNARRPNENEEDWLARVAARSVPEGVSYQIVDKSIIPEDRTWRDAWTLGDNAISVDIKKARGVRKKQLQTEINTIIEESRQEIIEADEKRSKELKDKIKALRAIDLDAVVGAAKSLSALMEAEPHKGV